MYKSKTYIRLLKKRGKDLQIRFNLKVLVFVLFFCLTGELEIYILLMLFAFLHECGHILCGIILGFKPQKLDIMPVGFGISFKVDTRNYNKRILKANLLAVKKLIIASAGPMVNLIFIILFLIIEYIFKIDINTLIYINILILIFNMLIIYPLDGGRILKNILHIVLGKIKALEIIDIISKISASILSLFTIILIILSKNVIYIFIVIYIWILVIKASKICKMKIKMYKILKNNIAINQD